MVGAGPDVLVALDPGVGVLVEDLGVSRHVLSELGDSRILTGEGHLPAPNGSAGGVQGLLAVDLDDAVLVLPGPPIHAGAR